MTDWADMAEASMDAAFKSEVPPAAAAAVSNNVSPASAPAQETSPNQRPATFGALGAALRIDVRGASPYRAQPAGSGPPQDPRRLHTLMDLLSPVHGKASERLGASNGPTSQHAPLANERGVNRERRDQALSASQGM